MKKIISFFLLSVVFTSCLIKVNTIYDHRTDFNKYKTFCWLKGCEFTFSGPKYLKEPSIQQQLQNAIISEMKKKGIDYNDNSPDLLMDVHVIMKPDTVYAFYIPNETYMMSFMGNEEIIMLKGTLVIDLVDKSTSQMIWRSTAISYFEAHPELTEKNFKRGVARALKDFKPGFKQQHQLID
jgi:Domain of unknown function (DUF4136)